MDQACKQPASTKIMNPAPFMGKLINDFNRGQNLSENFLRLFFFLEYLNQAGIFWDVSILVVFTKYSEIVITLKNSFRHLGSKHPGTWVLDPTKRYLELSHSLVVENH